MRKLALLIGTAGLAVGLGTASCWAITGVVSNTAFVDPEYGADSSSCGGESLANAATGPCQTLAGALHNIAPGGEIYITKPGIFDPIYLTASVSIIGPAGAPAVIEWLGGNIPECIGGTNCNGNANANYAVEIAAGTSDTIKLKNVIITNAGGTNGALHIKSASNVSLDHVLIRGGSGTIAQMVLVDSSQGSQLQLFLYDTDIGFSSSGGGVLIAPSGSTPVSASISNSQIHNTLFGVQTTAAELSAGSAIAMTIDDTQFFSFNNSALSVAAPSASATVSVALARSNIINTGGAALKVNGAGASASLFATVITHNAIGTNILSGGLIYSFQNSQVFYNGANCEVAGTSYPCGDTYNLVPQD